MTDEDFLLKLSAPKMAYNMARYICFAFLENAAVV